MKFWLLNKKEGFTVVEMMAAVGLFVVIVSIAIGAYIQVIKNQRFMTDMMEANDNVSLALEQMAREIRMGKIFYSPSTGCPDGLCSSEVLLFENESGKCARYSYDSVNKRITRLEFNKDDGNCLTSGGVEQALTSPDVKVTDLMFWRKEGKQRGGLLGITFDRIIIGLTLEDTSGIKDNKIQTTVSVRRYFK